MTEHENKPPMTEWDKAVVARLQDITELEKAGKIEYFTHEQVSANADRIIKAAQSRERKEQIKAYQSQYGYAI